jgi:hypothetical protein
MAIKVGGLEVISDSRKLQTIRLNSGVFTEETQPTTGKEVGDFFYDSEAETLVSWNGEEWN